MKKIFFWVLLGILLFLFTEGISSLGLFLLKKLKSVDYLPQTFSLSDKDKDTVRRILNENKTYFIYDSKLGWTLRPGVRQGLHQVSEQGLRSDHSYSLKPAPGMIRISAFGDSYTHGDDVSFENTWEQKLQAMNSQFEVLNFGVGGYGLDQAFWRYRKEGDRFHAKIVLIGFMSENIFRAVNNFRSFYFPEAGFAFSKPRFKLEGENLILIKNPMEKLSDYESLLTREREVLGRMGQGDFYFNQRYRSGPFDFLASVRFLKILRQSLRSLIRHDAILTDEVYNPDSEAFKITVKIFDRFYEKVLSQNAIPLILLFPNEGDIQIKQGTNRKIYGELIRHFEARQYRYVDFMDVFEEALQNHKLEEFFGPTHHYTPLGNEIVAGALKPRIDELLED
ncbi:MAG: SGNH/GDSL hydrolase family protein [Candidatus Omnitrophica bacterium]|nr:SGNH/GDSL hydrolase family protein [Candidatus Omnitrophota bacterium]